MPEFIEFVKACGTVILPLIAIVISIFVLVLGIVFTFYLAEIARCRTRIRVLEEKIAEINKRLSPMNDNA